MNIVDRGRLQVILNNTGLQIKDNPTYQFLNSLIPLLKKLDDATGGSGGGGGTVVINQISNIIQSLSAFNDFDPGDTVTFGPSVAAVSAPSSFVSWSVLTNGNVINPELIYAGGDVIMVHVP